MTYTRAEIVKSVAAKTEWQSNGCALWVGAVDRDGYPRLYVGREGDGRTVQKNAARLYHEIHTGEPLTDAVHLENTCGNRRCVQHLTPRPAMVTANEAAARARAAAPTPIEWRCGHPRTPDNTKDRCCRICRLAYMREYNRTHRGRKRS